ncbi:WxL domain-containing protein [Enterococcus sp. DIV0213h]|uniref:WxL domain-containing protein n=1 Tax=Enterococcus sp. DIV0213h TaxID=2774669 RepID=UPI003F685164
MRFRRPMLVLGMTILFIQSVFMSVGMVYAQTTMDTEEHEPVELPAIQNYLEELTGDPNFFFHQSYMQGFVNSPINVVISSDKEVFEVKIRLPEEATIIKDHKPERNSVVQGGEPYEWIVQSESVQTTFVLSLLFESEGNYELFLEDTTAMIEINRQEVLLEEELTTDQEQSAEDSDNNVSEKYSQNNSSDSLDTRNIVSVSTETQFRNAFNNTSVTRINLANNISLGQSLNILTRNLEINGNGFQLYTGNNQIILGNNSVLGLTSLVFRTNVPPSNTAIHVNGSNVQIRLRDFDYRNNMIVFSTLTASTAAYSVIFDGGVNTLSKLSSTLAQSLPGIFYGIQSIEILNNSVLNLTNGVFHFSDSLDSLTSFNISQGSTFNLNNTFLLGDPIRHLTNLNVEGKANMNITNTGLGTIENIRIGNTGEFLLTNDWSSGTISNSTNNIEIMRGSLIDIKNLAGATITDGDINVNIDSKNLALWDLGLQEEEKASIVFYDIHASLSGANASVIDTTTNDRFQKLYDSSGLTAYSRMSNRTVEEMERTVIAKYLDANSNEIIESEVITGLLGENYQTRAKQISGYQLIDSPSNGAGEFSRKTIEVCYVYETANVSPVDPMNPEIEVDPENQPKLPEDQGLLSIDFISSFTFGSQAISAQTKRYYAQPQRLLNLDGTLNDAEERPNYIQVSDRRPDNERKGWTLAVTQNNQFTDRQDNQLRGAHLVLNNQQFASVQENGEPTLQNQDGVVLIPEQKIPLVTASNGQGAGTWVYRFGDGESAGESVALEVPPSADPRATTYQTTLTWELSVVPNN